MIEEFNNRSVTTMRLANEQAQRLYHEYIGTEHVLLGLVEEDSSVAADVLKDLGLSRDQVRGEVERSVERGPEALIFGMLPITPRVNMLLRYAIEEANDSKQTTIGTGHMLLGMLREQEGVAAQVLTSLGLTLEATREAMTRRGFSE